MAEMAEECHCTFGPVEYGVSSSAIVSQGGGSPHYLDGRQPPSMAGTADATQALGRVRASSG